MASLKFFIKSKKDPCTIYARLVDGRKIDYTCSTTLCIDSKYWDNKRGRVKDKVSWAKTSNKNPNQEKNEFSSKLIDINAHVLKALNRDKNSSTQISKTWLKDQVLCSLNPASNKDLSELCSAIEFYADQLKTKVKNDGQRIALGTIKNFNTALSRVRRYQEHTGQIYFLDDLSSAFYNDFKSYLSSDLELSVNSVGTTLKKIRTVCFEMIDHGYGVNQFALGKKWICPRERSHFVTLNPDDLSLLMSFKGSDYLENARDWLIIGCYTACRFQDLMKLNSRNVHDRAEGERVIKYVQNKTGNEVLVAIHPFIERILERIGGFPRPISNPKFNEYIKQVCKKAGINDLESFHITDPATGRRTEQNRQKWELVKSHTCRRSYATNHYYFTDLPIRKIMAVTGHRSERVFLDYVKPDNDKHLDSFYEEYRKKRGL